MDFICLRTHQHYELSDSLGPDEIRFKERMFMHLQYACFARVVHSNAIAMTVFEDATDPFVARLPGHKPSECRQPDYKTTSTSVGSPRDNSTPSIGYYLCPATDHYCNDKRFHPLVNGKHKPVSDKTKEEILKRIESSSLSQAQRTNEKQRVKRYWSQHGL